MTEPLLLGLSIDINTGQRSHTICRGPEVIAHGMTRETAEDILDALQTRERLNGVLAEKQPDHEGHRHLGWLRAKLSLPGDR